MGGPPHSHASTLKDILGGCKYFVKITSIWDTRDNSKRERYWLLKEYNPQKIKEEAHKLYEVEREEKLEKIEVYSIDCKFKEQIKIK